MALRREWQCVRIYSSSVPTNVTVTSVSSGSPSSRSIRRMDCINDRREDRSNHILRCLQYAHVALHVLDLGDAHPSGHIVHGFTPPELT